MIPQDDELFWAVEFRPADRVAWLLRITRMFGTNEGFRRQNVFAREFAGRSRAASISPSQVSRWESGKTLPAAEVLTRYEEMLSVRPGLLTSVSYAVIRYHTSLVGSPRIRRSLPTVDSDLHDQLDDLLDRLLGTGPTTGSDWDDLSYLLIARPDQYLRRSTWRMLCERLVSEVLVAEGVPYFQRFEAMSRFMSHPRCQRMAVATCTALARDRSNQAVIETLSLLDATRHPSANAHLKEQLANPLNGQALRGALLASVRKVRCGHFPDTDLSPLATLVHQHAADRANSLSVRALATSLLQVLPSGVLDALRCDSLTTETTLEDVWATGTMARGGDCATWVQRIVAAVLTRLPGDPDVGDVGAGLCVLLHELLHSPVGDVRMLAAQTLAASPVRYLVADCLVAELASRRAPSAPLLTKSMLQALRFLGRSRHRSFLERMALQGPLPSERASGALWAYAHAEGAANPEFWRPALDMHLASWSRNSSAIAEESLHGLLYALGTHGDPERLAAVVADQRLPGAVRSAARWWGGVSVVTRTSAQR